MNNTATARLHRVGYHRCIYDRALGLIDTVLIPNCVDCNIS